MGKEYETAYRAINSAVGRSVAEAACMISKDVVNNAVSIAVYRSVDIAVNNAVNSTVIEATRND